METQAHDGAEVMNIIMRFQDIRRMSQLRRALFSVAAQDYPGARAVLMLQNFSESEIAQVKAATLSVFSLVSGDRLEPLIVNMSGLAGADLGSLLASEGLRLKAAYAAFLDCEDYFYPGACSHFVSRLRQSGAAIAFAALETRSVVDIGPVDYALGKSPPAAMRGLHDLWRADGCPSSAFAIDRLRIAPADLRFDDSISRCAEYEFALRICAGYPSDFKGAGKTVGVRSQHQEIARERRSMPGPIAEAGQQDLRRGQARIAQLKRQLLASRQHFFAPVLPMAHEEAAP